MTKLTRKNNQTSFQINEITHNGGVTQCVNLRHTILFSTERLTVAPQPEPKYSYKLIPLTSLPLTGEQLLYSPADSEGHANLYCCTNHGEPHLIQKINGEPKCAIPTESGAIVMTSDGPIEFKRKQRLDMPSQPTIRISCNNHSRTKRHVDPTNATRENGTHHLGANHRTNQRITYTTAQHHAHHLQRTQHRSVERRCMDTTHRHTLPCA